MAARRHSLKDLDRIARGVITGQYWMPENHRETESAFYMLLALADKGTFDNAGLLIGDMHQTVPGRGMNGCPIFLAAMVLHVNDLPYFRRAMEAKLAALDA